MTDGDYNCLDTKWNNFKRWFEAMEQIKDENPFTSIESIREMINTIERMKKKEEEIMFKAFQENYNE